jgi:hypothetical protein
VLLLAMLHMTSNSAMPDGASQTYRTFTRQQHLQTPR